MTSTPAPGDIRKVELITHSLRERLDAAAQLVAEHDAEVGAIRAAYAPRVRRIAAEIASAKGALTLAIDAARAWFLDPKRKAKTEVLHGVQVGFAQGGGGWSIAADADLVALVRERLPERAPALIRVTEEVLVSTLTEAERRVLGYSYTEPQDLVVIREKGSSIEKAVAALAKALPREVQP
jgi:phage host-nuclease inhibitor protein Gam